MIPALLFFYSTVDWLPQHSRGALSGVSLTELTGLHINTVGLFCFLQTVISFFHLFYHFCPFLVLFYLKDDYGGLCRTVQVGWDLTWHFPVVLLHELNCSIVNYFDCFQKWLCATASSEDKSQLSGIFILVCFFWGYNCVYGIVSVGFVFVFVLFFSHLGYLVIYDFMRHGVSISINNKSVLLCSKVDWILLQCFWAMRKSHVSTGGIL